MTLTAGRGPLSADPAGWFSPPAPSDLVFVEPHLRRVQAVIDGAIVLDTEDVLLVHRRGYPLSYAFPAGALTALPTTAVSEAPGYATVPWDAVDSWWEEGRELVHYPPNPYHRVDCRPTNRALGVSVAGHVVVDVAQSTIVFETALEPRLYVAPEFVDTEVLHRSQTTSYCNYKGHASYWSATVGGIEVADIAWSYPDPYPEALPIKGFLSFDPARADVVADLPKAG